MQYRLQRLCTDEEGVTTIMNVGFRVVCEEELLGCFVVSSQHLFLKTE